MIELRSVTKQYGDSAPAVEGLSMEILTGELCVLVGPSGCGKSTTLKMINRLIEPTSGDILIDDVDVLAQDAVQLRRSIGYVMQQGGLFPHLRIAENVSTVPRLLGWSTARIDARTDELLDLVGLDPKIYRKRYPHELSGGERQRVGVARALAADPPVLLMDEPFGAVDPIARKRLQEEFRELQERLQKTVVFVTHDIEEALFLGHRIAIMQRGGVLEQYDTPAAILAKPATPFVTEFVGVDRDLQRLAVTELSREDVDEVRSASNAASLDELRQIGAAEGINLVVIVDGENQPLGTVDLQGLEHSAMSAQELLHPFPVSVPLGSSLKASLTAMLQSDDNFVPVTESGTYLGLLSFDNLHVAMRRSAGSPPSVD